MDLWQRRSVVVGIGICVSVVLVVLAGWSGPASFGQAPDWQTYPDTHAWLVYEGDWQTHQVAAAAGGTLTGTTDPGAALTVRFEGTGVQVVYATGPEGQTFSATIDGHKTTTYSYSDQYSYGNMLPLLDLPPGPHTLTIANGDGALWIEAIQVQGELVAPPDDWTTFQDTDTRLTYGNGAWEAFNVAAANGGTLTGSAGPGATVIVRFQGTGIRVLYSAGPEGDSFTAQVDDGPVQVAATQDESYSHGHILAFEGLAPGEHTLTVTNGAGAIWVEAMAVRGQLLDGPHEQPEWALLFSDPFDDGRFDEWMRPGASRYLVHLPTANGGVVRLASNSPQLAFSETNLLDLSARFSVFIENGYAQFRVSESEIGYYEVRLHASGLAECFRNEALLTSATAAPFALEEWIAVEVTRVGGMLEVAVAGEPVLDVVDSEPLSAGAFVLMPNRSSRYQVDDLEIWIPAVSEVPPSGENPSTPLPAPAAVPLSIVHPSIGITSNLSDIRWDGSLYEYVYLNGAPFTYANGQLVTGSDADLAPDGTRIVVNKSDALEIIDVNTGEIERDIQVAGVGGVNAIDWSPDSSKLAFSWDGIYYVDLTACQTSCSATRLVTNPGYSCSDSPHWSPDGQSLVFFSDRDNTHPNALRSQIYVVDLNGVLSGPINPPVAPSTPDEPELPDDGYAWATWSPVGNTIAVSYYPDMDGPPVPTRIRTFDRNNPLVFEDLTSPPSNYVGDLEPEWSPHGDEIAFLRYDQNDAPRLYTVNVSNHQLTNLGTQGQYPSWEIKNSPDEQAYYDRFKGLMFWIIYNESSGNKYGDEFDIIEAAAQNGDPSGNGVVLVPSPDEFSRDQRSLLYMMARTLTNQIPLFEEGNEGLGYQMVVQYSRNWGGSINDVGYPLWRGYMGCTDTHGYGSSLPPYQVVYELGEYARILDWFSDYADCQVEKKPEYSDPYSAIMAAVDRAVEDHVANAPNPVENAYFMRNANSCYLYDSGGGCFRTSDLQSWCQEDPTSRNCRASLVWVEESPRPVGVTVNEWWSYSTLPEQYRQEGNPDYLWDPTGASDQQLVYATTIDTRYHISTGLYDNESGQSRYFLMGVGRERIPSLDSIDQAFFLRHWNRLNRDQNPVGPETYYPGTCVSGMSHVLRDDPDFETWVTWTFQTKDQFGGEEKWFCDVPGT